MTDFISQYRAAFEAVGRPLTAADVISEVELEAAQQRLGHRLPKALLDFYRVAGNAKYLENETNLCDLQRMEEDEGRLVCLCNEAMSFGIDMPPESEDPMVHTTFNGETWDYDADVGICSEFLTFCIYHEAFFALQMPFVAQVVSEISGTILKLITSKWELAASTLGEWGAQIYLKSRCVIYLWPSRSDLGVRWNMWVGAIEHQKLDEISQELAVTLAEI